MDKLKRVLSGQDTDDQSGLAEVAPRNPPPPAGLGEAWPGAPAPRDGGPRAAGAWPGMAAAAARGEPGPRCCRFTRGENALINSNNANF